MKQAKRLIAGIVLALALMAGMAGTVSATVPGIQNSANYACYRTMFWTWTYFIGYFATDQSGDFGAARVHCYPNF